MNPMPKQPPMRVHNPYQIWMKETDAKQQVTREEFEKRVQAPTRLNKVEDEIKGIKSMLGEIAARLNGPKKLSE